MALLAAPALARPPAGPPPPTERSEPKPAAPERAGPERTPAQRETLADLAYVLGQAHALRVLCEGEGEQVWRARMARMVELENPDDAFREQLYDGFNTGFLGAQAAHTRCDARARTAVSDVAARGRDLAQALAAAR